MNTVNPGGKNALISTYKTDGCLFVEEGTVDVYVARQAVNIDSTLPEEERYLCSFGKGTSIPFYNYRDKGYVYWYFKLYYSSETAFLSQSSDLLPEEERQEFLFKTPAAPFVNDESISRKNRFNECLIYWYDIESRRQAGELDNEPEATSDIIYVDSMHEHITGTSDAVYTVVSGAVNIFMGCSFAGEKHRYMYLAEVSAGQSFPSFGYRDAGGINWYFKIAAAKNDAEITMSAGASEQLQSDFLSPVIANEPDFVKETLEYTKGFNNKVSELYRFRITPPPPPEPPVSDSFGIAEYYLEGKSPLFRAVSFACYHSGIAHRPEEDILRLCQKEELTELTIEDIAEHSHFIFRKLSLEKGWWKRDCGTIIADLEGEPVACVPKGGKYLFYRGVDANPTDREYLTPDIAEKISPDAYSIGRTLPGSILKKKDIWNFCKKSISIRDVVLVAALAVVGALIGILLPTLNQKIYDDYIPLGSTSQIAQMSALIISFMIANLFFSIVKNISEYRIGAKVAYDLQNATVYRSFFLPERFFRKETSADITQRILSVEEIVNAYSSLFFASGVTFIVSIAYLIKMAKYSGKLTWAALGMLAILGTVIYFILVSTVKSDRVIAKASSEASSRLSQYLGAIDKVRMAGAEERAAQRYLQPVREKETANIRAKRVSSIGDGLKENAATVFSMVLYYMVVHKKLDISFGNFSAFNSAFGSFTAGLMGVVTSIAAVRRAGPKLERLMILYETPPEYSKDFAGKSLNVTKLNGKVTVDDVSFSYAKDAPLVLNGLSFEIEPGDYVGIVGRSGCGKSTLLKLLLGFESPTGGKILIDGKNLEEINKKTYRRKLGVVLQNGGIISGSSIWENVTITSAGATEKDVWDALRSVGMEKDIKETMPMGLQTIVGPGSISGGQLQRILIARALIGKPNLIILDEATSALDNITQKTVCDTLDGVKATKIVVAHRLSTIRNCNKIIVLDKGKVVESGNYGELMAKKGLFAEMAMRQLVDGEGADE